MQESSQWNCGEDYFITLHVVRWQIHCSQGPQVCGRESPLCLHWRNTPASQGIFSSLFCRHWRLLWPFQLSLSHCYRPCTPLFAPFTNQPGWRRSCRCTARKHAAATIIALIACFFCWAEISSGATKLLLKPPKNLQVKMAGCVLKKIHKKKRHSGVRSPLRMPIHCRMAHTCMLAPPLK